MGVLYKPFSIVARMIGKRVGRRAFADVWTRLGDGEVPPAPTAGHRALPAVFWTAALQAAVLAGSGAIIEQLVARVFHQLFGAWPGQPVAPADPPPAVASAARDAD